MGTRITINSSILWVVLLLAGTDCLLTVVFLLNYRLGQPSTVVTAMFNLNGEGNFAAWYSSAKLLATGLGFMLVGWRARMGCPSAFRCSGRLLALALFFIILSADETAEFHEKLGGLSDALLPGGTREDTVAHRTGIWMFVIGLPAFLFWLALVWPVRELGNQVFVRLLSGMLVFGASAFGVEFLSNFTAEHWQLVLQIALEEWGELTGETLMVWAMLSAVVACFPPEEPLPA